MKKTILIVAISAGILIVVFLFLLMGVRKGVGAEMMCMSNSDGGHAYLTSIKIEGTAKTIMCEQEVPSMAMCMRMLSSNNQELNPNDAIPTCNTNII